MVSSFVNSMIEINSSNPDLSLAIYRSTIGHGCSQCEGDFLRASIQIPVCLNSNYLQEIEELPSTSSFIEFCESYVLPTALANISSVTCEKCYYEFVVATDKLTCHPRGTLLLGCKTASSTSACSVCMENYVKVGNECKLKNIFGCTSYNEGMVVQTCLTC